MNVKREPNAAFSDRIRRIWRAVRDEGATGMRRGDIVKEFMTGNATAHIDRSIQLLLRHGYLVKLDPSNIQSAYCYNWECKPLPDESPHLGPGFGEMPPEAADDFTPQEMGGLVHDRPLVDVHCALNQLGDLHLRVRMRDFTLPAEAVPMLRDFLVRTATLQG